MDRKKLNTRKAKKTNVVEASANTCLRRVGQTVPDTGRRIHTPKTAITPGAIAGRDGVCDRALMQRKASCAEIPDTNAYLQKVSSFEISRVKQNTW